MHSGPRRVTAFTLVELLVVIGIIAVLISVLLPALSRARASAQAVACSSNMRQIGQAMFLYANENGGVLPFGAVGNGLGGANSVITWDDLIGPFIGMKLTDQQIYSNSPNADVLPTNTPLRCPSDQLAVSTSFPNGARRSYAMNRTFTGNYHPNNVRGVADVTTNATMGTSPLRYTMPAAFARIRLTDLRNSSNLIVLAERPSPNNMIGSNFASCAVVNFPMNQWSDHGNRALHGNRKRFNYLFADGHVTPFEPAETFGTQANIPVYNAAGAIGYYTAAGGPVNGWNVARGMWSRDPND